MQYIHAAVAVCLWIVLIGALSSLIISWKQERNSPPLRYGTPIKRNDRYARLRQNGGSHTDQEWIALCVAHNGRCMQCKKRKPLTMDHIIPVSKGGTDDITNIQPMCRSCNSKKGINVQ